MLTYDEWLTTEPPSRRGDFGEVDCPCCEGDGAVWDGDCKRECGYCDGRGWLWPRELDDLERERGIR